MKLVIEFMTNVDVIDRTLM